jgi:hypothetical protein
LAAPYKYLIIKYLKRKGGQQERIGRIFLKFTGQTPVKACRQIKSLAEPGAETEKNRADA